MEHDPYKRTLSQNLKAIRKSKGLTTVDLAKILGVSQAKVSYIEHCKGVLSARDVAVLSKHLNISVTEFFKGLNDSEDVSEVKEVTAHLAHYGAVLLAKRSKVTLKTSPFEEVFGRALAFTEDDRLHKGLCAALISQASSKEINVDRIFSIVGNNHFLTVKAAKQSRTCLRVLEILKAQGELIRPRAKQQIEKILRVATQLGAPASSDAEPASAGDDSDIAEFVKDCLHA